MKLDSSYFSSMSTSSVSADSFRTTSFLLFCKPPALVTEPSQFHLQSFGPQTLFVRPEVLDVSETLSPSVSRLPSFHSKLTHFFTCLVQLVIPEVFGVLTENSWLMCSTFHMCSWSALCLLLGSEALFFSVLLSLHCRQKHALFRAHVLDPAPA